MIKGPLLLVLLATTSCDRPPAVESPRAEAMVHPKDSVPKAPSTVAAQVDSHSPPSSLDLAKACNAFAAILVASATANGKPAEDVGTPRDTTMGFGGTYPEHPEPACRVAWTSDTGAAPLEDVFTRAKVDGWAERDMLLSADGPDGSVLAFSRGDVACLIRGEWDGGDDSDSTYVPSPGFTISASCFPNRPDRQ